MNKELVCSKFKLSSLIISYVVSLLLIVADQLSKFIIVKNIPVYENRCVIDGFFYLHHTRNTGSAFSMFANKSWGIYLLAGISLVMSFVIMFVIYKSMYIRSFFLRLSFILFLAGAVGNLIDRVRLRYVVDFLRFDFGSYTFPIFNFADICAVLATAILILMMLFQSKTIEAFMNLFEKKGAKNDSSN